MSKKRRKKAAELFALTRADGQLFHDDKGQAIELPRASAPLADTHGHLTHFHQHRAAAALARASLVGVGLLGVPIDPVDDGCNPVEVLAALDAWVEIADDCIDELLSWGVTPATDDPRALLDNVRIWAGVHPYGAEEFNASAKAHTCLEQLLASPRAAGVGEFGLDYGPYNRTDPKEQLRAFEEQLHMAHDLGLPVELHIRDADGDVMAEAHRDAVRILEHVGVPQAGCDLHCYTSGPDVMKPFVDMGCYVAFGGAATFARSEDIRAAAVACPAHQVLTETDSPYMAPVPLRGMECEPAMVAFSADTVACAREEAGVATREETYQALWDNAHRLFGMA